MSRKGKSKGKHKGKGKGKRQTKRQAGPATPEPDPRAPEPPTQQSWARSKWDALVAPQPIERLELLRILAPLAILAFLSSRLIHADEWLSAVGFQIPDLAGRDPVRQPIYLPPLPLAGAWALAAATVASGLSLAAGLRTRLSAGVFAACLVYLALADRLATFTVSKLGAVVVIALFFSPCGVRYGVDAWRRRRAQPEAPQPTHVSGPNMLFFQLLLVVIYFGSGICKARGHWLEHPYLLWTHLHDSYQTPVSYALARTLPAWAWTVFQGTTLAFEIGAPLWFGLRRLRPIALAYGLAMHAMIGLMFGPVIWFSTLMMSLLMACYLPERWLARIFAGR
ncbi:MAG: HTTM domain-containing protein [Enhygromyxa sp.]